MRREHISGLIALPLALSLLPPLALAAEGAPGADTRGGAVGGVLTEAAIAYGTLAGRVPGPFTVVQKDQQAVLGTADEAESGDGLLPGPLEGAVFESGTGTAHDPYVIQTAGQLRAFAADVNAGRSYAGACIRLGGDIDLSGGTWTPIGTQASPFSGTFDGGDNAVTGMTIPAATGYTGFFGYLSGAEVRGLTVADADITCGADAWVGVLAGRADASAISDCHVSGRIVTADPVGTGASGNHGIAAAGAVEYLYQSAILRTGSAVEINVATTDEIAYVGGLACEVNGSRIEECTNTGGLRGYSTSGYSYVGGIAAYIKNGSRVIGCRSGGAITSGHPESAVYAAAGGILGQIWYEKQAEETVSGCTNTGAVTAVAAGGDSYAGGIVGESYQYDPNTWAEETRSTVTIADNAGTGTVTAAGAAGGILGWGDAEWKLNLSGNSSGMNQTGAFGAPADMTFGDVETYEYWDGYLHVFQVMRLAIDPGMELTVGEAQTLVVESGVALSGGVTVQSGGRLIVEDGGDAGTVAVDGTGFLVSFRNDGEDLGQIATDADGRVRFPEQPSKAGHIFAGWYTADGTRIDQGGQVSDHVVLTARWTVAAPETPETPGTEPDGDYPITVARVVGGKVTVNPGRADQGDLVTITAVPSRGYVLRNVSAASGGNSVAVRPIGDNRYTFTMPGGAVRISATFVKEDVLLPFGDVPVGFWARTEIAWAHGNGYVNGTAATSFRPNEPITRQQVWMILARIAGENPADMAAARAWAVSNGVSDGSNPGSPVTRQQLVTILYRFAERNGYDTSARADLSDYPDAASVAPYAADAMAWAVAEGIINGTMDGVLNPAGTASRAQSAVILYRCMA